MHGNCRWLLKACSHGNFQGLKHVPNDVLVPLNEKAGFQNKYMFESRLLEEASGGF